MNVFLSGLLAICTMILFAYLGLQLNSVLHISFPTWRGSLYFSKI